MGEGVGEGVGEEGVGRGMKDVGRERVLCVQCRGTDHISTL